MEKYCRTREVAYCLKMASFSWQHRSVSQRILLISVLLLLNSPMGLCSCYKRIFSFGDSLIDTGNFAFSNRRCPLMELPYGMTYFKRPTGRVCDGRVLIDFYGEYRRNDQSVHSILA
jgi:hypothetical protein